MQFPQYFLSTSKKSIHVNDIHRQSQRRKKENSMVYFTVLLNKKCETGSAGQISGCLEFGTNFTPSSIFAPLTGDILFILQ